MYLRKKEKQKFITNYYDLDLNLKADDNEITNSITGLIDKIRNEFNSQMEKQKMKEKNPAKFKDTCDKVLFSVSYPKMYFRKDKIKND